MSTLLLDLLAERDWLIADGATGTSLFAMGLEHGAAPDLWCLEQPGKVRAHYRSFIDAGADIVLTNSFGGTANRLKLHDAQDKVHEVNRAAAALLRQEIAASGRTVVCAGSVGPTGDLFEPLGPLSIADGVAAFTAQMEGLRDGGADVAWIETISAEDELEAALRAAEAAGLPAVATLSLDTNGRTMMGVTPSRFAAIAHDRAEGRPTPPIAWGGNCGTGAPDLLAGLISLQGTIGADDIIVAKANCGIPEFVGGELRYSGTLEQMAAYARLARDLGARIIGGCCGTTPEHVRAMRAALEGHDKAAAPTLEQVVAAVGRLTGSTKDLLEAETRAQPRERGRGRRRTG